MTRSRNARCRPHTFRTLACNGVPPPPLPVGIYSDGLLYSQVDTVVGVWLINLVTGSRSLIALMRNKSNANAAAKVGTAGTPSW